MKTDATLKQDARQGLSVFFTFLIPLSIVGYWFDFAYGSSILLAFMPALASIGTRLIRRKGFKDVSFRFNKKRSVQAIILSLALPLVVGFVAYGTVWISGLAQFNPAPIPSPFPSPNNPSIRFGFTILLTLTVVTLYFAPMAAGEEIGWRGYMLTRLIKSDTPYPILVSGLIWGIWHLPLIIGGHYSATGGPNLILSVVIFMVVATSFGYFLAWLRLGTGSIWPAIVAHAAWNAVTQAGFNAATHGEKATLWIGESGIFVATILIITVFYIGKKWKPANQKKWKFYPNKKT